MSTRDFLNRNDDGLTVTERVERLYARVLYIKEIGRKWTILDPTEEVGSKMYQLVWLAVTQIV